MDSICSHYHEKRLPDKDGLMPLHTLTKVKHQRLILKFVAVTGQVTHLWLRHVVAVHARLKIQAFFTFLYHSVSHTFFFAYPFEVFRRSRVPHVVL